MSVRPLRAELQRIAEVELNEVPTRVPEDLEHIREWLLKQRYIRARMDDQWLIVFLRGTKFRLELTKEKLNSFYTARTLIPETFLTRDPFDKKIQETLNARFIVVLPGTYQYTKPRMVLASTENLNPDIHSMQDIWKIVSMVVDMHFVEEDTLSVIGLEAVLDLKNLNYKYAGQITPTFLKNLVTVINKAYPIRIKRIVIINAKSWLITICNALKLLLNDEQKERIILCDAHLRNSLSEYSIQAVMKEYCGEEITWDELAFDLKRKIEKFRHWYLEDLQYGVDRTEQQEITKTVEDMHGGVQGTFRKLNID